MEFQNFEKFRISRISEFQYFRILQSHIWILVPNHLFLCENLNQLIFGLKFHFWNSVCIESALHSEAGRKDVASSISHFSIFSTFWSGRKNCIFPFHSIRAQAKLQNYLRKMGVTLIFSYLQSGRRLSGWTMLGNCNSRELILLSVLTLAAASSNSSTFACKATVEGNLPVKLVGFLNSKIRNIVLP